jgi:single-stranded-DNA-specific exonuclease
MQGWLHAWSAPAVSAREFGQLGLAERVAMARGIALPATAPAAGSGLSELPAPESVPGAVRAGELLAGALRAGERIAIHGDYDADGICAASILVHVLRAARPDCAPIAHVPLRMAEGYGLSASALEQFAAQGATMVVTVDCGITALAEARRARELGMRLVVTDHHAFARSADGSIALPDADAVVHPALAADGAAPAGSPAWHSCGALVAWMVAWAFARSWSGSERVQPALREALLETLPLAALGTITDVMPLQGANRALVRAGLARLSRTGIPGLAALVRTCGVRPGTDVDVERVQFSIGPVLNASGRIGDANAAVELLSMPAEQGTRFRAFGEPSPEVLARVTSLAASFVQMNERRKTLERMVHEQAVARVEREGMGASRGAVVLADAAWPRGIVGIASARVVERTGLPTVLLSIEDGTCHGSARSVEGYSILEGLNSCAAHLLRWGGHAAAAGVSLDESAVDAFREALSDHASRHLTDAAPSLRPIDCTAGVADLDERSIRSVARMGPFGPGWPEPTVLVPAVRVVGRPRAFGKERDHAEFVASVDGPERRELRCVWWRQAALMARLSPGMTVNLVAELKLDDFRGGIFARVRDVAEAAATAVPARQR